MYADLITRIRELPPAADGTLLAVCLVQLAHVDDILVAVGHDDVERVFAEFGARLGQFARPCDRLIRVEPHRYGVLITGLRHRHHLTLALAKLQRLFEAPAEVDGRPVMLAIRAGVCIADLSRGNSHAALHETLRNAQRALIRSAERGCPIVAEDAQPATVLDWTYLARLSAGLERDEFVPFFQPTVACGDESVVGAELLLRWWVPERGLVLPDQFIPLAERADLIRPLTWFVLKAGIAQASQWPPSMGVSVNAAAAALEDNEIVHVIGDALAVFGVQPERLVVEVTESGIMRERTTALKVLGALRRMGVRVSIDDFGTGYSSFAKFRDIPADELKIDRSFVANLHSPVDAQLVRSIIELAHNLNLQVVAEGVESRWMADRLKAMGCDRLQGFLFGMPVPADEFQHALSPALPA
jgi:EAL domain-containing protein (putative c-di-GMP-specific phosphodiesterase class I)